MSLYDVVMLYIYAQIKFKCGKLPVYAFHPK